MRSRLNSKWCTERVCGAIGLLLCLLLGAPAVTAAATLSLIEESPGRYRIDGAGLADVAAFDLNLTYDAATLQIEEVVAGALLREMLFAGNAGTSGVVKIGAVGSRAVSGSGELVRLTGSVLRSPIRIRSFSAQLHNAGGQPLPVQTRISLLSVGDSSAAETPTSGDGGGEGSAPVPVSAIQLPQAPDESGSPPPEPLSELPPRAEERAHATEPLTLSTEGTGKEQLEIVAVQQRFAAYRGPRTLAALTPLFRNDREDLRQTPEILLTDGTTPVEVVVRLEARRKPGVALKNARLLQSGFIDDTRFRVRCLPSAGAFSASIILLEERRIRTIPLTVAPPVPIPAAPAMDVPLPALDLNADGEHSWQDDYILVANLLAADAEAEGSATQKPAN